MSQAQNIDGIVCPLQIKMKWENALLKEKKSIKSQGVTRILPLSAGSSTQKEGRIQ